MKEKKHSHLKHMGLMMLGCLLPIGLIIVLRSLNIGSGILNNSSWLIFLICPLMHIFMMKGMMGHNKDCNNDSSENSKKM